MDIGSLIYLAIPLAITVILGFAVAGWRPLWPVWRVSLASAAILPVPILLLGVWVFVTVLLTPAAKCGVDACGMGALAGMMFAGGALVLFLLGGAVNFAVQKLLDRP